MNTLNAREMRYVLKKGIEKNWPRLAYAGEEIGIYNLISGLNIKLSDTQTKGMFGCMIVMETLPNGIDRVLRITKTGAVKAETTF